MRKYFIFIISVSMLCGGLFYLIHIMNPAPGTVSGNGNPAIIFIILLVPLFFILVSLFYKILILVNLKPNISVIGIILISFHWLFGYFYQRGAFIKYKNILQDKYYEQFSYIDYEYIEQITSFLSIHVNKQFFNLNTYLMFISLALLLAFVFIIIDRR